MKSTYSPLVPIAIGLATSNRPGHRWRQVVVAVGGFLATLVIVAAGSTALMFHREVVRGDASGFEPAVTVSPTDLLVLGGSDEWQGQQILVGWIEPADPRVVPVLPRGVTQLPAPGQAAVSPALAALLPNTPELAKRYPDPLVMDWSGVVSGADLVAYVRPPQAMLSTLPQHQRARSFTAMPGADTRMLALSPPIMPWTGMAIGLVALALVPAIILAWAGLSAASPVRAARFALLRALGLSSPQLRVLAALEAVVGSAPGVLLAVLGWAVVSPHLGHLPLTSRLVVPGDLSWPIATYPLSGFVIVGLMAVIGLLQPERSGAVRPRPTLSRSRLQVWIGLPLGVAGLSFATMLFVDNSLDADLALVGSLLAVVGIACVTPAVIRAIGTILAPSRHPSRFLAGRALAWRPEWISKSFAGLAALIVVTLGSIGYVTSIDYSAAWAQTPTVSGPAAALVNTPADISAAHLSALQQQLPDAAVVTVFQPDPSSSTARLDLGATCSELQKALPLTCDGSSATALSTNDAGLLQEWVTSLGAYGPDSQIRLVNPAALHATTAMVLANTTPEQLDLMVRPAAMTALTTVIVSTVNGPVPASAVSRWLTTGVVLANSLLLLSCLVAIADRIISTRHNHHRLLLLGAGPRQLRTLFRWLFAAPYVGVSLIAVGTGLGVCHVMCYRADFPIADVAALLGALVVTGLIGVIANQKLSTARLLQSRD